MDVIWNALAENDPAYNRLRLFCRLDPASGALFVISCHHMQGITYEENFQDDCGYLIDSVLPDCRCLEEVELDWTYLERLEDTQRTDLFVAVGGIEGLKKVSVHGNGDVAKVRLCDLVRLVDVANSLERFAVDVSEIVVEDRDELVQFSDALGRCEQLKSLHLSAVSANTASEECWYSPLFAQLAALDGLGSLHVSRLEVPLLNANGEPDTTVVPSKMAIGIETLRSICKLSCIESLSLVNMGLDDSHCDVLCEALGENTSLKSLVLLDNNAISETGNAALLKLLHRNHSIYSTLFGIDIDCEYRSEQLKLLHMNRCGRGNARSTPGLPVYSWIAYIAAINETVPEEFELDALFSALTEHPELVRDYRADEEQISAASFPRHSQVTLLTASHDSDANLCRERKLALREKNLERRLQELADREQQLLERERRLSILERCIEGPLAASPFRVRPMSQKGAPSPTSSTWLSDRSNDAFDVVQTSSTEESSSSLDDLMGQFT